MNKLRKTLYSLLLLAVFASTMILPKSYADELHVAVSYSASDIDGLRLGYRWTDAWQPLPASWLAAIGSPRVHYEAAINSWENTQESSERINALTFSPVLQWRLTDWKQPLYLEAGIGVSLFDEQQLAGRELSISFQFEDRIGLSWEYDQESKARVSLGYSHYSQADLAKPNDGLDLWVLSWHVPL